MFALSYIDCRRLTCAFGRCCSGHQLTGSRFTNGRSVEWQRTARVSRRQEQQRALQVVNGFRHLQDSHRRRGGRFWSDIPFAVPLSRAARPRPASHGVAQQPRDRDRSEGAQQRGHTGGVGVWGLWLRAHNYRHQRGKKGFFSMKKQSRMEESLLKYTFVALLTLFQSLTYRNVLSCACFYCRFPTLFTCILCMPRLATSPRSRAFVASNGWLLSRHLRWRSPSSPHNCQCSFRSPSWLFCRIFGKDWPLATKRKKCTAR